MVADVEVILSYSNTDLRDIKEEVLEGFDPTPAELHSDPEAVESLFYVGYEETGISPQCPHSGCAALFCLTGSPVGINDSRLDAARVHRCSERRN